MKKKKKISDLVAAEILNDSKYRDIIQFQINTVFGSNKLQF